MAVNTIYSTSITDTGTEPITTSQAKLHASIDYTEFDTLIPIYISAARKSIELATGIAIVEKTVKCQATIHSTHPLKLAYSPVQYVNYAIGVGNASSCSYYNGSLNTNGVGVNNEIISVSTSGNYEIEYVAGYTDVPADLKLAILQMFTFIFNHRGEFSEGKLDISVEAERIMLQNARFLI